MAAETPGHIVYPLPSEPVRDGAAAIRALAESLDPPGTVANVGKGFRPVLASGTPIATNGNAVVGPARVRTWRANTTTNGAGQFSVDPAYGQFNHLLWADVSSFSQALLFPLSPSSTTQALVFTVYNPATGAALPNRAIDVTVLIIGA